MLASIRASFEDASDPLAADPADGESPPDLEQQVQLLGIWRRFVLFMAQLVGGRDRTEVITEWMVRDLERELEQADREALDGRRRLFLEGFARELEALRDAAASMRGPLTAFRSHRRELVVVLAGELFPAIHAEVLKLTDEQMIAGMKEDSEAYLKRELASSLEKRMDEIPASGRGAMRRAISQADTLLRLADLPFQEMLDAFEDRDGSGRLARFESLGRPLSELYRALITISQPIDLTLIEMVVLIADSSGYEQDERPGALDEVLRRGMQRILTSLATFRDVAERHPLLAILRVARSDPWWITGPHEGGEDWIALYRSFATERIHRQVLRVSLNSQLARRAEDLAEACGGSPVPLAGLPDPAGGQGSGRWYTAAALASMARVMWPQVMPHLRIVLTSGEFYKSSNRAQFNDAYSELEQIPERLRLFSHDLSADEPWGRALAEADDPERRAKVVARLDQEVETVAEQLRTTMELLSQVVGGVLYARPGSSFDTLANFGQIGGRRNAEFIDELKEAQRRVALFAGTLGEILALERRAAEHQLRLEPPALTPAAQDVPAPDPRQDA